VRVPELLKDKEAVIWIDMAEPTKATRMCCWIFFIFTVTERIAVENRHYPKSRNFRVTFISDLHGVRADTGSIFQQLSNPMLFWANMYIITREFRSIDILKRLYTTSPIFVSASRFFTTPDHDRC